VLNKRRPAVCLCVMSWSGRVHRRVRRPRRPVNLPRWPLLGMEWNAVAWENIYIFQSKYNWFCVCRYSQAVGRFCWENILT